MTRHHALLTHDMPPSSPTVSVKLQGKHGRGRSMVLDEVDWSRVRLVVGEVWNVSRAEGREYVMTFVGKDPSNPLKGKTVKLARWLTWAEPGEVVSYRDGDPLNLTRANLVTMGRRGFLRGFGTRPRSILLMRERVPITMRERNDLGGPGEWSNDISPSRYDRVPLGRDLRNVCRRVSWMGSWSNHSRRHASTNPKAICTLREHGGQCA